jgi:NAD(P)-dependent dehydrogenase (short-subunit alcohol dehydrogenase family)
MLRRPRFDLTDRTVVITGAARGIGRATALAFARKRAHLELFDRDGSALSSVAEACRSAGARSARASVGNVAEVTAVEGFAAQVHERWEGIDVLVNNAGVGLAGGVLDAEITDLRWVFDVNLWGTIHFVRAFAPAMIAAKRGGRIVNVASVAGWVNTPAYAAYGVSKFAVIGLSEALRDELAPHDIRVSAVCPGFVDTDLPDAMRLRGRHYPEHERVRIREFYRRHGIAPERVADAILTAAQDSPAVLPVSPLAHGLYYLKRFFPSVVPLVVRMATRHRPTDP